MRSLYLSGYDLNDSVATGTLGSSWVHLCANTSDGSTQVGCSADGRVVVGAGHSTVTGLVSVEILLGNTGQVLATIDLPGLALNALDVSRDGTRIAISAGLDLYVLDHLGNVLHQETSSMRRVRSRSPATACASPSARSVSCACSATIPLDGVRCSC